MYVRANSIRVQGWVIFHSKERKKLCNNNIKLAATSCPRDIFSWKTRKKAEWTVESQAVRYLEIRQLGRRDRLRIQARIALLPRTLSCLAQSVGRWTSELQDVGSNPTRHVFFLFFFLKGIIQGCYFQCGHAHPMCAYMVFYWIFLG